MNSRLNGTPSDSSLDRDFFVPVLEDDEDISCSLGTIGMYEDYDIVCSTCDTVIIKNKIRIFIYFYWV